MYKRQRKDCGESLDDAIIDKITEKRLLNEVKSGIQTIQYQLITLMTCNGQAPFVTMFMYLDEVPEGCLLYTSLFFNVNSIQRRFVCEISVYLKYLKTY